MTDLLLAMGLTSLGVGLFLALGMILLLMAPKKTSHRLLAAWVILVAISFVIQHIGLSLDDSGNNALTLLNLSRLFGVVILMDSLFSTYGVVFFLNLEKKPTAKWMLAILTIWTVINIVLVTILFDLDLWMQVSDAAPAGQLNPFDFISYTYSDQPAVRYTMYSIIALATSLNWINLILFWRYEVPVTARIGSFMHVLATLTAVVPVLEPLLPLLIMSGGVLVTHAVLTSRMFDPLRSTNDYLAEALNKEQAIAQELETTLVGIEAQVRVRKLELQAALAREKELSLGLERSLQQESELNQLKTLIISNVSHEFRAPLTIIKNSSDMLNRCHNRLDEATRTRYTQEIYRQINYLDELLHDMLFINESNRSDIVARAVSVAGQSLFQQLVSHWEQEVAGTAQLRFDSQGDVDQQVQTDIGLLQQIGHILISNAIKFCDKEPEINVHFRFAEQLILEFVDNGIGIVSGKDRAIFEFFQRGSNVQSRRGLGIGLYTVRKIVGVLGGQFFAEERPGGGSLCRVVLPYQQVNSIRQQEPA